MLSAEIDTREHRTCSARRPVMNPSPSPDDLPRHSAFRPVQPGARAEVFHCQQLRRGRVVIVLVAFRVGVCFHQLAEYGIRVNLVTLRPAWLRLDELASICSG